MFVFDSFNALKASTDIVEGVLYKAPDRSGALRTWQVKTGALSRDILNYKERCTGLSNTFVVNKSGYFANSNRSYRTLTPDDDDGLMYLSTSELKLFMYLEGNWVEIPFNT